MSKEFFLRFSLQQMGGCMSQDVYEVKQAIDATEDEMDCILCKFKQSVQKRSDALKLKYHDVGNLKGKKVLFVGDSITADKMGYRNVVCEVASLDGMCLAYSGATSTDMYRFVNERICTFNPDIVSVMIGTNDAFFHSGVQKENLVSKCEYERNIRGILETATKHNKQVIISTIPQCVESALCDEFKYNTDQNISAYNQIVRKVASDFDVMLVDFEAKLKTMPKDGLYEPDGVHLSPDGHDVLASLWLGAISKQCS